MTMISEVTSYLFGDNLLISLSKDWLNIFEGMPKFSVEIKNKKLVLSSQIIKEKKNNNIFSPRINISECL